MDEAYCCVGILNRTQMPKGIPVATVAIGNAENAGLLAVRILAARDPELWDRYGSLLALLLHLNS
jgi:phosphoribosylcarboxyaminoimidazole (NCAIR) mutase